MQKKNGDIDGFKMLVFTVEIARSDPIKYEPPSPKNIKAYGKLNLRKTKTIIEVKNKIYIKSLLLFIKLITNKTISIIKA
jgi:hypothetical protein